MVLGYNEIMEDSLFTKIIRGEIPSYKVYEDDDVYAFLDIHPISTGHTLVVPKKQVEFLWDMDEADYIKLQVATQRVAYHLRKTLNVPFVGVQVVGIDVPHAHIHLIPFTNVGQYQNRPDMEAEPNFKELKATASKVIFE